MKLKETYRGEKLPEAELDVMLVLWKQERPMKAIEILDELRDTHNWKKPTLQVLLGRLTSRGFLKVTQEANYHMYTPLISEDCIQSGRISAFSQKNVQRIFSDFGCFFCQIESDQ